MEYEKMSLADLKEIAKKAGMKSISSLRKQELIDRLKEHDKKEQATQEQSIIETEKQKKTLKKVVKQENNKKAVVKAEKEEIESEKAIKRAEEGTKKLIKKTEQGTRKLTGKAERVEQENGKPIKMERKEQENKKSIMKIEKPLSEHKSVIKTEKSVINAEKPTIENVSTPINYHVGESENDHMISTGAGLSNTYRKPQIPSNAKMDYRNISNRGQVQNRPQNISKPFGVDNSGQQRTNFKSQPIYAEPTPQEMAGLDSGETKEGILEVMPDGYGFIRCDNFLPGENDVYVSPAQIRRQNLKTGDIIVGNTRVRNQNEKFSALLYLKTVNGMDPLEALKRKRFEDLTPIFPNQRIHLETPGAKVGVRMMDLVSPIGKGQRGMIVSPPKAGKTTLLKQVAGAITRNHPEMHLIILLIDERPEEVTDIKESIEGKNVEVIYSTFDELPENHKRVSEMVIERARRLVEHKKDVTILLDSITRLTRAYNLVVPPSGRTLSGGLDPAALHMPKKFFGAARNIREGGSLTILATALVETGSRMDDVVFEEFKGTGNMEIVLDRSLSEKRIFPAIDLHKSSTRRDDLLLAPQEMEINRQMHRVLNGMRSDDALERIIELFVRTKSNKEFMEYMKKTKF